MVDNPNAKVEQSVSEGKVVRMKDKISINPLEELLKGIEVVHGQDYSRALRQLIYWWSVKQIELLENTNGDGI